METCNDEPGKPVHPVFSFPLDLLLFNRKCSKIVIWQMSFSSWVHIIIGWSSPFQLLPYCGDLKCSNLNVWRSEYIAIWMVVEFASKITHSEQSREGALAAWIWSKFAIFLHLFMMMKMTIQGKRICNTFCIFSHQLHQNKLSPQKFQAKKIPSKLEVAPLHSKMSEWTRKDRVTQLLRSKSEALVTQRVLAK